MTTAELIDSLRASADTWSSACGEANIARFRFSPGDWGLPIRRDGRNVIRIQTGSWCSAGATDEQDCYARERVAITHLYPSSDSANESIPPKAHEADIEINGVHHRWDSGPNQPSMQSILIHELGHVLGLPHPCEGAACKENAAARTSIMFPDPFIEGAAQVPSPEDCMALAAIHETRNGFAAPLIVSLSIALVGAGVLMLFRSLARTRSH